MEESFTSFSTTLLLLLLLATLAALLLGAASRRDARLPPGPLSLPIIGHLHLLRPPLHQAFHRIAARHGPLVHLRLGSVPCLLVSSPDVVHELFKNQDLALSSRPQSTASRRFAYDSDAFAFGPYGPYYRFLRKLCMSDLLGARTVEILCPIRRAERLALLHTLLSKSRTMEPVDLSWELIEMTNNIITRMIATTTTPEEGGEARKLVKEVAEVIGAFNIGDFIGLCRRLDLQGLNRRIDDVHRRFDVLLERIISEKEQRGGARRRSDGGEEVKDLLDIMLKVAEDENAEIQLTRENIKGFVVDLFSAGSDSSAATIEWALSELINHPDILDKTRHEIDEAVGDGRLVEESDILKMPYLQAVFKETLRLHPAAPLIIRETTKDIKAGQYDIPAGTSVFVNAWSLNRDPKFWEDSLEFRPERFMAVERGSQVDFRGQHFQFLSFGTGRRICPGLNLALPVVQVTLAALIQCFEWKTRNGGEDGALLDMSEGIGLVTAKAQPLVCVPVARLDPLPSV